MERIGVNRERIHTTCHRIDDYLLALGRRAGLFLYAHRYLMSVLLVGAVVWGIVFNIGLSQYLTSSTYWNYRHAWLGPIGDPGEVQIFGYTIVYQFEGYSDYSFYYVHWGHNLLNGVMPYSDDFGYLDMGGVVNENGAYIFPPLTAYLYGLGIALGSLIGPGNWGIGLLIALFGYLTAIPVYGIAKEFSNNRRVGEIAALTYLLNPLVLYHICFIWLNPAPFYFFFFAGFYALVKGRRHTGTLLIVTAALFKQTAWFLGIPLVVYLLLKPRIRGEEEVPDDSETSSHERTEETASPVQRLINTLTTYLDIKGFTISVVIVLLFVGAIMFPYLVAEPYFWDYWRLAMGSFSFEGNFTDPPAYVIPIRLPVLAIMAGQPELAELIDTVILTGGPLAFGVMLAAGGMLLTKRFEGERVQYLRRVLFITLLMMLWVNLTGPRGFFKYYYTMFAPFFSIFASSRMIRTEEDSVPVSLSMIYVPILFSLSILIPDRNYYLAYVILIFIVYSLAPVLGRLYDMAKRPARLLRRVIGSRVAIRLAPIPPAMEARSPRAWMGLQLVRLIIVTVGLGLTVFGFSTSLYGLTGGTLVTFQYMVVGSMMILLGPQIALLPLDRLLPAEASEHIRSQAMTILSASAVVVLWIFGASTYAFSWYIDSFVEREVLILSSIILLFWAPSLLIDLSPKMKMVSYLLLLGGLCVGMLGWSMLGDVLFFRMIIACMSVVGVLFIITLVDLLQNRRGQTLDDSLSERGVAQESSL